MELSHSGLIRQSGAASSFFSPKLERKFKNLLNF